MSYPISFLRYQTNCVIKLLLIKSMPIFLGSTAEAMADREKKRGRRKYKNLNILRTKRTF